MTKSALAPHRLDRWPSFQFLLAFGKNPLVEMRKLHDTYGPHVQLQYPHSTHKKPQILGCIADAELYRAISSDQEIWRSTNLNFRGFKHHASRRLGASMTRYRGIRATHYRKLFAPPLSKPAVMAMSPEMAAIAQKQVALWRRDEPLDFLPMASHLTQDLAIGLLFGDDLERAKPIAALIERQVAAIWPSHLRDYLVWLTLAAKQERLIMDWAEQKRGNVNPKDIMSIIVNNPDEYGDPVTRERIGSLVSFTFGAAYETCQNAIIWTLVLLTQHPRVVEALTEEIRGALGGGPPTIDRIGTLPLLDGAVKEGMRLFPPVAFNSRRSLKDTELGGTPVRAGARYLASTYLINRNPDIYPEPDHFRPERWKNLNPSAYDYAVFGGGGRMCPGFTFALQMVKTAIAAIVSQHRVEIAQDTRIDYRVNLTLNSYPAVPIVLRDINSPVSHARATGRFRELVQIPDAA
ncbi:MAG: cytochrome P450 [Pseudolabrys sp.]